MTSADRNDLLPAQEKLEWVTPMISVMDTEDTDGAKVFQNGENNQCEAPGCGPSPVIGSS